MAQCVRFPGHCWSGLLSVFLHPLWLDDSCLQTLNLKTNYDEELCAGRMPAKRMRIPNTAMLKMFEQQIIVR